MNKLQALLLLSLLSWTVSATYTLNTTAWIKPPVSAFTSSETGFSSAGKLFLAQADKTLLVVATTESPINFTYHSITQKPFSTKNLVPEDSVTYYSNTGGNQGGSIVADYHLGYTIESDSSNIPQLYVYQTSYEDKSQLKTQITQNNQLNTTPEFVDWFAIDNVVYIVYELIDGIILISHFETGKNVREPPITLTNTAGDPPSAFCTWGKALKSGQAYCVFTEFDSNGLYYLKEALVDLSGSTAPIINDLYGGPLPANTRNFIAFASDSTMYGVVYWNSTGYFLKTNLNLYAQLIKFAANYQLITLFPYGPYFAAIWVNVESTIGKATYSYQIFTTELAALNNEEVFFASGDQKSTVTISRVSGKVFAMFYNRDGGIFTDAVVGQILSGSIIKSCLAVLLVALYTIFTL